MKQKKYTLVVDDSRPKSVKTASKQDFPQLSRHQRRQMVRLEDKQMKNAEFEEMWEANAPARLRNKNKKLFKHLEDKRNLRNFVKNQK